MFVVVVVLVLLALLRWLSSIALRCWRLLWPFFEMTCPFVTRFVVLALVLVVHLLFVYAIK